MKRSSTVLTPQFFTRPVLEVAPDLLGKYLVVVRGGKADAYRITEVEAYDGETDLACHASKGRTKRTEVMYGPPGHWYVYLIYGMYEMLNIVTGPEGYPAAVLIRGVEGYSGPGKLTRALGIGREVNTEPAHEVSGLWIEDRNEHVQSIITSPRIGIAYAGEWADMPWRYTMT